MSVRILTYTLVLALGLPAFGHAASSSDSGTTTGSNNGNVSTQSSFPVTTLQPGWEIRGVLTQSPTDKPFCSDNFCIASVNWAQGQFTGPAGNCCDLTPGSYFVYYGAPKTTNLTLDVTGSEQGSFTWQTFAPPSVQTLAQLSADVYEAKPVGTSEYSVLSTVTGPFGFQATAYEDNNWRNTTGFPDRSNQNRH